VQAFLGFANFYQRFIKGYSKVAKPLTRLTRRDLEFAWRPQVEEAFKKLKRSFTEAPVIVTFNLARKIVLETDSSDFAIGACLRQLDEQKKLRLVAYYS